MKIIITLLVLFCLSSAAQLENFVTDTISSDELEFYVKNALRYSFEDLHQLEESLIVVEEAISAQELSLQRSFSSTDGGSSDAFQASQGKSSFLALEEFSEDGSLIVTEEQRTLLRLVQDKIDRERISRCIGSKRAELELKKEELLNNLYRID